MEQLKTGFVPRILVVDDNPMELLLIKRFVEKSINAEVFIVDDGPGALKLLSEHNFSLAIFDIHMPTMSGFDLAMEIKEHRKEDTIPIIFITGIFKDAESLVHGYDVGAIDYIIKPIDSQLLLSKVKALLQIAEERNELNDKIKNQNKKLRIVEESFHSLFYNASIGVFRSTVSGKTLLANPAAIKILGYSSLQELKDYDSEGNHVKNHNRANFIKKVLLEGEVKQLQTKWEKNTGEEVVLLVNAKTIYDSNGMPLFVEGNFLDITQLVISRKILSMHKNLSLKLSGAQTFNEAAKSIVSIFNDFENISAVLVYFNNFRNKQLEMLAQKGDFLASDGKLKVFGYKSDTFKAIIKKRVSFLKDHETPGVFKKYFVNEKANTIMVIPIKWRGIVLGSIIVVSKENIEQATFMLGMFKNLQPLFNISFHKIYFNSLQRESKNNLEQLFNSIDEFVFIVSQDWKILDFNNSVTKKLGYSKKDLCGVSIQVLHPQNRKKEVKKIIHDMTNDKTKSCPIPILSKEGKLIPVETEIVQSLWNNEKVWIGISRDISERVKRDALLAYRLEFEELMTKIALRFLSLDYKKTDEAITQSLKEVGTLLGVDRSYVFLFNENASKMDNTHEWCNEGVGPQMEILQNLESSIFPWWMDKLTKNETINIPNVNKLPNKAQNEKDILESQDIKSVIVVPMYFKYELIGFVGFDAVKKYMDFSADTVKLLNVVSSIITNAITHKRNNIKLIDYQNNLENKVNERTKKTREVNEKLRDEINIRKKTERELKKWHTAIEQSAVSVYITDIKGEIEYVNPQVYFTTGYKPKELLGKNIKLFKSRHQGEMLYENIWEIILKGKVWKGIVRNKAKTGKIIWEDETISPVKNRSDEIVNFIIIRKDITSEKMMEDQMLQSVKMEALGKLAGGIAHDINNILQIISIYTDLLGLGNQHDKEGLKQIRNAIERGSKMLGALLDYSRNKKTIKESIKLNDVFEDFIKVIKSILPSTIDLNYKFDMNCNITGNKAQLEEVLLNLVLNAKDSITDKGKIDVELRCMKDKKKNHELTEHWVVLNIKDDGKGMDKEIQEKIFDPFFTTKEVGKGTGLGLSMVLGIIEQHNGFIEFQSKPGEGSSFQVYLPENTKN